MTAPDTRPQIGTPTRRLFFTLLAAALAGGAVLHGGAAEGGERWMAAPSYHSHQFGPAPLSDPFLAGPAGLPAVPVVGIGSRAAYRPAVTADTPGFSVRGAVRINRVQFSVGGSSDATILHSRRFSVGR